MYSIVLFDHADLSQVCHFFHFIMNSSNHHEMLKNDFSLGENIHMSYKRFLYRESLFTNVFDQNFFVALFSMYTKGL